AAGGELRHARRRDVDLLRRVARIHARAGCPVLRRELAESGERDLAAALERVGELLRDRVDGLACVAGGQLTPVGDFRHKFLLRHVPLLLSLICSTGRIDPTRAISTAQPCGFAGLFVLPRSSPARNSGRSLTACRASASAPPSSRSTTQTAVWTTRPAPR